MANFRNNDRREIYFPEIPEQIRWQSQKLFKPQHLMVTRLPVKVIRSPLGFVSYFCSHMETNEHQKVNSFQQHVVCAIYRSGQGWSISKDVKLTIDQRRRRRRATTSAAAKRYSSHFLMRSVLHTPSSSAAITTFFSFSRTKMPGADLCRVKIETKEIETYPAFPNPISSSFEYDDESQDCFIFHCALSFGGVALVSEETRAKKRSSLISMLSCMAVAHFLMPRTTTRR